MSLFIKVKKLSKVILDSEPTHHASTRTSNHLHVYQNLDLVWLGIGQSSNHLTVVIGIFNINGISLAEQNDE